MEYVSSCKLCAVRNANAIQKLLPLPRVHHNSVQLPYGFYTLPSGQDDLAISSEYAYQLLNTKPFQVLAYISQGIWKSRKRSEMESGNGNGNKKCTNHWCNVFFISLIPRLSLSGESLGTRLLSHDSCILLSNGYMTGFMSRTLSLLLHEGNNHKAQSVLCDYCI